MSAFEQKWKIEHPEYLMRPISFAGIHQAEGHDDYSGDVDGLHLDHTLQCAILIDIKYRRHYCGELKPHTQKAYEVMANAMTAGGVRTYILIAGHDVDLHKEGAMVPIERCQAIEVYYPKSRVWHAHAQDKADMNGVACPCAGQGGHEWCVILSPGIILPDRDSATKVHGRRSGCHCW